MKNFFEQLKGKKLRTILVTVSVFLFGFIVYSFSSNLGNTYAAAVYTCPSGYSLVSNNVNHICCPNGWSYSGDASRCTSRTVTETYCNTLGGAYDKVSKICWLSSKKATQVSSDNREGCYRCGTNGNWTYSWSYSSKSGCTLMPNITSSSSCSALNKNTSKPAGPSKPSTNTAGCYRCGTNGNWTYGWSYSGKSGCLLLPNIGNASSCSSLNSNTGSGNKTPTCWRCNNGNNYYKNFWQIVQPLNNCSATTNTFQNGCLAANTYRATFTANSGGKVVGDATPSCTLGAGFSCEVKAPTAERAGYTFGGWSTTFPCTGNVGFTSSTVWLTGNINYYSCWAAKGATPENYNSVTSGSEGTSGNSNPSQEYDDTNDSEPESSIIATTRKFYTITYDLDGGEFLDGTKTRKQIITSDKVVGDIKALPIKDGYKLKEWQAEGKTYDFNQHPTKDITVKAIWEELTEEDKEYTCKSGYTLEPTTKQCYKVLVPDNVNTFNYTVYKYQANSTFCYAYHSSTGQAGGVNFRKNRPATECEFKCNKPYSGYDLQDSWISEDTCRIASECKEDQTVAREACEVRWDAIIFSTISAEKKEEEKYGIVTDNDIKGYDDPDPDQDDGDNISENPYTGSVLIIVAWIIGISAIGFGVYYYKHYKKNNSEI